MRDKQDACKANRRKPPLATYWISPGGELSRNHLAISIFCLSLSSASSSSAISLRLRRQDSDMQVQCGEERRKWATTKTSLWSGCLLVNQDRTQGRVLCRKSERTRSAQFLRWSLVDNNILPRRVVWFVRSLLVLGIYFQFSTKRKGNI